METKMEYIIGEGTPMFKSYYVVWKLMKLIGVVFYIGCLNRTM